MKALARPRAWYATDVHTSMGLARFVFVADGSWDSAQASWLERVLTDAETNAQYTIAARHHPIDGVGGGPSHSPPGFATLQNNDATLSFVMRGIDDTPVREPWTVPPQQ
jgi:hypothetical protein